jgi:preprotein translocase subunit SecG
MLQGLLVFLYVAVCLFLIAVVLLQTGKRADLAGAFGGGGSQTAFGSRGAANLLTRLTTGAAVAFMLIALTLSVYSRRTIGRTVLGDIEPVDLSTSPAIEETIDEPTDSLPPASDGSEDAGDTGDTGQP